MVPAEGVRDALWTADMKLYAQYLTKVYTRMAEHVPPDSTVMEVCVRPTDRGVLSRRIIPHSSFIGVDKNPKRCGPGDLCVDVLKEEIVADVIISTAILHHTPEDQIPRLLRNLNAPILLLSGPHKEVMPDLIGDHRWHIEPDKLMLWLHNLGFRSTWTRSGLSEPLAEVLILAKR